MQNIEDGVRADGVGCVVGGLLGAPGISASPSLVSVEKAKVLKILAREHSDDGVRFNAVTLLDEAGQLEIADLEAVLTRETDPDAQQAIYSCQSSQRALRQYQ